jgi:hypothetical protein
MPDVSIYVAVITAAAGLAGATIPQVTILARDARQAERDRRERRADARRQACLDLLGAAGDLRTSVMSTALYHGPEIAQRLADVEAGSAAVNLHAVNVALLAPDLSGPAERLAQAARDLALMTRRNTDVDGNQQMTSPPEFTELDDCVGILGASAVASARTPGGDRDRLGIPGGD